MHIPIIDLSLENSPETRPLLLDQLRDALFRIGFLYLVNHGAESQAQSIQKIAPKLFQIPTEEKLKVSMVNNPHFVGYNALGTEVTQRRTDLREQFDFGTAKSEEFKPGDPLWKHLHGPTQYIPDSVLPGFQARVENYFGALEAISSHLLHLVAESLHLDPAEFDKFKGRMDRMKIIKYPAPTPELQTTQGVGAHKDSSGLFTFILQDQIGGLQVLGPDGEWIDATPIPGSLVVNIAQGFEALTGGRCTATTHRVLAPPLNSTRYSIAYFQGVKLDLTPQEIENERELINGMISEGPKDLKRRQKGTFSEFLDPRYGCFGEAHLRNRIISHSDVAAKWYPELQSKYLSEIV